MSEAEERGPARGFIPTLVVGIAAAALTAAAAAKPWVTARVDGTLSVGVRDTDLLADLPVALALSLVALAAWGAILVTRGAARRVVALIGAAAAAGTLAAAAVGPGILTAQLRDRLGDATTSTTAWYLTTWASGVLSVVALVTAFVLLPQWPTMSARYDAPSRRPADPVSERDLWNALSEGVDPTDRSTP